MKQILFAFTVLLAMSGELHAQGPEGRSFGFGVIFNDPTGGTIKTWFSRESALQASIGGSYYGAPRLGVDYLWQFNAFRSSVVDMYAGIGGVLGFGEGTWYVYRIGRDEVFVRARDEVGFAVRGVLGLDVMPRDTPLEIFFELGPLFAIQPGYGTAFDSALGIRIYP